MCILCVDTAALTVFFSRAAVLYINCVYACLCFQRLHTDVEAVRTDWDKYIKQVSSEMVVKDTEIITLQERETKLKTELDRSREQTER